jgi:hypothetical protein
VGVTVRETLSRKSLIGSVCLTVIVVSRTSLQLTRLTEIVYHRKDAAQKITVTK